MPTLVIARSCLLVALVLLFANANPAQAQATGVLQASAQVIDFGTSRQAQQVIVTRLGGGPLARAGLGVPSPSLPTPITVELAPPPRSGTRRIILTVAYLQ